MNILRALLLFFFVISVCFPCYPADNVFPLLEESFLPFDELNREDQEDPNEGTSNESYEDPDGWSQWSPWMTCSRSCDGGISVSLRKCKGKCPQGPAIRRQICNMQPCPEPSDFRATQCAAYNDRPYRGRKYVWLPYHDPEDPCALTCTADGFHFVAKHSPRVQDGTRCREGALDMCVHGKCQPIGCDLQVGSTLKVDECGVCGGDGSQCPRPTFEWHEEDFALCSVTCGGGIQLSEATCRNKGTGEIVDPRLCNLSVRPRSKAKHCNRHPCPVVWEPGDWGPCSATCGSGVQTRPIFCVQGGPNGTRQNVQPDFCPRHKPQVERPCSLVDCPRWFQGPWTPCSVTCGQGIQTRAVVCRDPRNQYSELCEAREMPRPQKTCEAADACPTPSDPGTTPPPCIFPQSTEEEPSTSTEETTTPTEPIIYLTQAPSNLSTGVATFYFIGPWGRCNGEGVRQRIVHCQVYLELLRAPARLPDSECAETRPIDMEPCSNSCPPPFPPRNVDPDERVGEKSKEDTSEKFEEVVEETNLEEEDNKGFEVVDEKEEEAFEEKIEGIVDETEEDMVDEEVEEVVLETLPPEVYIWNTERFSPCTISCGGGTHKSILRCLKLPGEMEVSAQLCDSSLKPVPISKKCSEQPCPLIYKWSIGEYSDCSMECGGGIKSRDVKCMADDEEASFEMCSGAPPKTSDSCNVFDCEPAWRADPWSKCSRSCSGGFQSRKLYCEKILAPLGQPVQLPPAKCIKTRPKAVKKCNLKPCPSLPRTTPIEDYVTPDTPTTHPADIGIEFITASYSDYVFEQQDPTKRVTLKAAGQVILFKGANAKFHCPVPEGASGRVLWFKGHVRMPPSSTSGWPRVSVSGKGALRVYKAAFSDAGTYTCLVGAFRSDLHLKIKSLPKRQPEGMPVTTTLTSSIPTTLGSDIRLRKVTNRSTLPKVQHFRVNMRHFAERLKSDTNAMGYEWLVRDWSKCSHSCGEAGIQIRATECHIRAVNNVTREVPKGLCVESGLPEPPTVRYCHLEPCPEWVTGEWSECTSKNCLSWNTSYQKRGILCRVADRTVSSSQCDGKSRPRRKRECFHTGCKGKWKSGKWTDCSVGCGSQGFRSRSVQCVWISNDETAPKAACQDLQPASSEACGRKPCSPEEEEEECFDQSTYCNVVKRMKLCKASQFRLQCCASCKMQQ